MFVCCVDNHVWAAGSITDAVKKAKRATGFSMKIEVECRSLEESVEAVRTLFNRLIVYHTRLQQLVFANNKSARLCVH